MNAFLLDLATQIGLVITVVAAFFLGPGLAILILSWQKRRRLAARRSPMNIQLLRSPGHALQEQIEDTKNEVIGDVLILAVMPLVTLAIFLAQAHVRGLDPMWRLAPLYAAAALVVLGVILRRIQKRSELLYRLRAGHDAEVAVGQALDLLMRQGAFVFHDIEAEGFNVDHVVVHEGGVIAVETKGFSKTVEHQGRKGARVVYDGTRLSFPHMTTAEPIEQAERQTKWLGEWLSQATGESVAAMAVVALPGWYVERNGEGIVKVFSGGEIPRLLEVLRAPHLTPQRMQRIAFQLEQRCRNVPLALNANTPHLSSRSSAR